MRCRTERTAVIHLIRMRVVLIACGSILPARGRAFAGLAVAMRERANNAATGH
jgi:hypothetical protein